MIGSLDNLLRPFPAGRHPSLRLLVLSFVLTGLFFAASAHAQEAAAPESSAEAPTGEGAPTGGAPPEQTSPTVEQTLPSSEEAPSTPEAPVLATEQAGSPSEREQSPAIPEESSSAAEQSPPPVEDSPPAEQTPPAAEEDPPPAAEQTAPPVAEQTPSPAPEQTSPAGEQAPPADEAPPVHEQAAGESQAGKAGGETGSEERAIEGVGGPQTPTGAAASDHKEPTNEVVPASSAATAPDTVAATPVISIPIGASQISVKPEAPTIPVHQARQGNRPELAAACEAPTIATGSVGGWLDALEVPSVSTIALAIGGPSAAADAFARARSGGPAIESHAVATTTTDRGPGPAPGGASGGSAAGAGSSAASAASSFLVGSLLQAAPNVMLRLCVSQPSWQTSFFALFPERPG